MYVRCWVAHLKSTDMFVEYPDGQRQNKPGLSQFRQKQVFVQPTARILRSLPKRGGGAVRSVKTSIHLGQTATSHLALQPVLLANLDAFFALVMFIRTVDPLLGPAPVHAYLHQGLTDRILVYPIPSQLLLVAHCCQHFQGPQAALVTIRARGLMDDFSQALSSLIVIGSLVIMPSTRFGFQTDDPTIIEGVQYIADLLIALSDPLTDRFCSQTFVGTHQNDLAPSYGQSYRRFQSGFQCLALFATWGSCIYCSHEPILPSLKLSAPIMH